MAIKRCKCKHKAQDKMYGEQNRVHNPGKITFGTKADWICTVCKDRK